MKKIIFVILLVSALLFTLVSCAAGNGDYVYELLEDGTYAIADYVGKGGALKLPAEHNGKPITVIGEKAFDMREPKSSGEGHITSVAIRSVVIPKTVRHIENSAFLECQALESVIWEEGSELVSIGNFAFLGCVRLEKLAIPRGVESIGRAAFEDCASMTAVLFEEGTSLKCLEDRTFYGCSSLVEMELPQGMETIGHMTFGECRRLVSLSIPGSVTKIQTDSFYGLCSLERIAVDTDNSVYHATDNCLIDTAQGILRLGCRNSIIPNDGSVREIGAYAFFDCEGLSELLLPSSVELIDNSAFMESSLVSVDIPRGVKVIGSSAFEQCKSLREVSFESDSALNYIFDNAFCGCISLSSIEIPRGVTKIGKSAFESCESLCEVTFEKQSALQMIDMNAFGACLSLTEITLPSSIETIADGAFSGAGLIFVVFDAEARIREMGSAFINCRNLRFVELPNTLDSNR